jgi:tetratricopeptide (TPR) repeat protein
MGFFDLFRSTPKPVTADPDELRDLLFDAVGTSDKVTLERLIEARADVIASSFEGWTKVPAGQSADPAIVEWTANGLEGVANYFAKKRGDESLLPLLNDGEDDVILRWEEAMTAVDEALKAADGARAEEILNEQLPIVRDLNVGGASTMLAMVLGRLGLARFVTAPVDDALDPLLEALEVCRDAEDLQGEHTCLASLSEVFRYLGDWEQAADCLDEQSEVARTGKAEEIADQLAIEAKWVRAGEPLNRVLALVGETPVEPENLPARIDGRVRFIFRRNRPTLSSCTAAIARGLAHGKESRFDEALAAFQEATEADPLDPQGHYQAGVTLLRMDRPADARDKFDVAERLAPGWFHVRSDRWIADAVATEALPDASFKALNAMESGAPHEEKVELAQAALEGSPFPHLELHLGLELMALGRHAEAVKAWRHALDGDPEPDVQTRILGQLAAAESEPEAKAAIFEELLAVEDGNLVARASALLGQAISRPE